MKIISWNVNGIRACYKKDLMNFLYTNDPDIFCVQETKANSDSVSEEIRFLWSDNAHWSNAQKKGYSGVATFSKIKPLQIEYGINRSVYDLEGRFVITQHPSFLLYNIYFPNGAASDERHVFKQKFLSELKTHLQLKLNDGHNIIVVGDYNIAHKSIDIYDSISFKNTSGFLPEERAWVDEFLSLGFVDTFRYFYPDKSDCYSWWSYRQQARFFNHGWRIDYICVSKGLVGALKSAAILDNQEGSDHCPVMIELDKYE